MSASYLAAHRSLVKSVDRSVSLGVLLEYLCD